MKRLIILVTVASILGTTPFSSRAHAATQAEINASVAAGLAWLASQQLPDGSWHYTWGVSYLSLGTTGLAVTAFIHHAKQTGQDPFADTYPYKNQVVNGLNYLFTHAQRNAVDQLVGWGADNIYALGPALMAITASGQKHRVVNLPGSAVDGMTFEQIAKEIVNFIGWAQGNAGQAMGMWYYGAPTSTGDMSVSGWVALGLGYASHNFDMVIDPVILDRMSQGIDLAQWTGVATDPRYGGVGYTGGIWSNWYAEYNWYNLYKAGHLLYMMELCGDPPNAPRVLRTLDFIQRHWYKPNSGESGYPYTVNGEYDMGWRGGPWGGRGSPNPDPLPSWIASTSMMKAFISWGIESLGGINWYEEMAELIVALQEPNGSWNQGGYPHYTDLATIWALLTTLRAVPTSGSITDITLTSAIFHAMASENGIGYFVVLPRNAPPPTENEIVAGTGAGGVPPVVAGSGPMVADVERLFPLTGLSPNTRYDLYFVNQTRPATYSNIVRVQFATLSPGSMVDATPNMTIRCQNWRLDHATGALLCDFWIQFNAAVPGKPELHTAFWVALPNTTTWKLQRVDGTTPGGVPYTDITTAVEAQLRARYQRDVMRPGDQVVVTLGVYSRDRSIPPIQQFLSFWADPPPLAGDTNLDGVVDDLEVLTAVDEWKAGRMGDFLIMSILEHWRNGSP